MKTESAATTVGQGKLYLLLYISGGVSTIIFYRYSFCWRHFLQGINKMIFLLGKIVACPRLHHSLLFAATITGITQFNIDTAPHMNYNFILPLIICVFCRSTLPGYKFCKPNPGVIKSFLVPPNFFKIISAFRQYEIQYTE